MLFSKLKAVEFELIEILDEVRGLQLPFTSKSLDHQLRQARFKAGQVELEKVALEDSLKATQAALAAKEAEAKEKGINPAVVEALKKLKASLAPNGLMIVKENRPTSANGSNISANEAEEVEAKVARAIAATEQEESFFRVDTPSGPHARYDVTRPDAHHRWLFRCAGLRVEHAERCINGEVTAWALAPSSEVEELLEAPGLAVVVT